MAAPFSGLASHRLNAARTASCIPQRREEPQTTDSPVGDAIRRPPTVERGQFRALPADHVDRLAAINHTSNGHISTERYHP
jgi:hypothetical protein